MSPNLSVYILDDESAIGTIVCRVLDQCGLQGKAFEEPTEFISGVTLDHPHLIILDLSLGRTDAIEVIRSLEAASYQGDIILMSGRSNEILAEVTKVGLSRGLSMLPPLHKPFKAADLKARLAIKPTKRENTVSSTPSTLNSDYSVTLVDALQNNWLELWYQPKINLHSLSICGAEALVRINHPQFGIVLPGQFLPEVGNELYHPLSSFVLAKAVSDWNVLASQGIITKMAVNMPASVVLKPDFVMKLRTFLPKEKSFPGLIIEVTEDEVLREAKEIFEVGLQLQLLGVDLSIDDFGTANASLARLRDLPCAELKLDRSFVSGCSSDERKRAICQTVIGLAKRFNASVCAEGVETREDLVALIAMGFDTAQGYLFAKPLPLAEFSAMMLREALHILKNRLSGHTVSESSQPLVARSNAYAKDSSIGLRDSPGLPLNYYFNAR